MKEMSITLKVRLICSFFENLITMAFLPFMALYLSDMVSQTFSGVFLFLLVLVNFPISMISGHVIERFSKKRTLLIYQTIECISLLVMAFAISNNMLMIIVFCCAYTVFSITSGMANPLIDTIIMEAITPKVEHYIYKVSYWLTNVAVACGAFIGGIMYSLNKSALFFIAFVIFALVFIALYIWIPNDKSNSVNVKSQPTINTFSLKNFVNQYQVVLKDKIFMYMIIGSSILLMGELSTSSYISVRLKEEFEKISLFNIPIDGIKMYSILIMTNTFVVITLTYFVSKYILKMNNQKALFIGLILYVIGYSGITYLNEFTLLIIFMVIATFGEMIYSPIFGEQRYKVIPENKRGTYSAVFALSFHFAALLARLGIILGVFLNSTGMTIYMFLILLLGSFLLYDGVRQFNKLSSSK